MPFVAEQSDLIVRLFGLLMEAFILINCHPWKSRRYMPSGSKWCINTEIFSLFAKLPPIS